MKTLLIAVILSIVTLCSCEPSNVEKLISDYEQTIGTTKTDLNLKIKKLDKIHGLTVGDSLNIIRYALTKTIFVNFKRINDTLTFSNAIRYQNEKIALLNEGLKDLSERDNWPEFKEHRAKRLKSLKEMSRLELLNSLYLKMDTAKELLSRYKCTYTINNPVLNGVKQEITCNYLINTSTTFVIKDESID